MALILNQSQAEVVYSAMRTLNQVGGAGWFRMQKPPSGSGRAHVTQDDSGVIHINKTGAASERYADQSTFAAAYGLSGDEHESAPSSYAGMFGTSGNMTRPER